MASRVFWVGYFTSGKCPSKELSTSEMTGIASRQAVALENRKEETL